MQQNLKKLKADWNKASLDIYHTISYPFVIINEQNLPLIE